MKKTSRFASLLLPIAFLASCSSIESSNLIILKSKYDNGKYFEEINRSQNDSTKVYMTVLSISNREKNAVTFKTEEFKMTIDKKDYSPLCFVKSYQMNGTSVGGGMQFNYYIAEETQEYSCPVSETEMSNLILAFETFNEQDFKLTYKGTEVQSISSK